MRDNILNRRDFIKTSALGALLLSSANAFMLDSNIDVSDLNARFTYFLKDSDININNIKADRILVVNNDISDIYGELKNAFKTQAIIGGIGSETTLFVISEMAADYKMRVIYNKQENGAFKFIIAPKGVNI